MKTFAIFIGGSGARVLRSLTMLLAAGVKPEGCNEIVPIVIDYDKENADLLRSKDAIERYKQIHDSVYKDITDPTGFFSTKLSPLEGEDSFYISMEGNEVSFAKKIQYDDLNALTKKLITTLYSDWDDQDGKSLVDKNELNLNLKKGFKGNPNIGSAIFNEVLEKPAMKNFFDLIGPGDRVFISGSIFGGTGSTGIPQIVNKCRSQESKVNDAAKNAPIALNIILPYFGLKTDNTKQDNSTIDSNTFSSKSKAALYYYKNEINQKVQEVYYIGSNEVKQFDNNDGGKDQKNQAHIVELLSAMSLIEFASREQERLKGNTKFFEYQTPDESPYTLGVFHSANDMFKSRYLYPFKAFGYFWKHYKSNIFPNAQKKVKDDGGFLASAKVYYKYCFKDGVGDQFTTFKNNMEAFLFKKGENDDFSFESWLHELDFNEFRPFFLKNSYDKMINKGNRPGSFITNNTNDNIISEYDSNASTMMKDHKSANRSKQSIFIEIASVACMKLAKDQKK